MDVSIINMIFLDMPSRYFPKSESFFTQLLLTLDQGGGMEDEKTRVRCCLILRGLK